MRKNRSAAKRIEGIEDRRLEGDDAWYMGVLMNKSVCSDCVWKHSCQKLKRISECDDQRDNPGHVRDIFDVIVVTCSTKNFDRSYRGRREEDGKLYYCGECSSMHHSNSKIGRLHKKDM